MWATVEENLSSGFAINKGADQPAHPHSLISAFIISLLESIISKVASSFSVAERTGLSLALSGTPNTCFVVMRSISTLLTDLVLSFEDQIIKHRNLY